jgi:hypothetical protein
MVRITLESFMVFSMMMAKVSADNFKVIFGPEGDGDACTTLVIGQGGYRVCHGVF